MINKADVIIALVALHVCSVSLATPENADSSESELTLAPITESPAFIQDKTFIPAEIIRYASPMYPRSRFEKQQAGAVHVIYKIGKDANISHIEVLDSTHKAFEISAKKAVRLYKVGPASVNGNPVDSYNESFLIYALEDHQGGVSQTFKRYFDAAISELSSENPNKDSLERTINRLENMSSLSPNAIANLNILKFRYSEVFENKEEQLSALKRLLWFGERSGVTTELVDRERIHELIVRLLIDMQYFGEAKARYEGRQDDFPKAARELKELMPLVDDQLTAHKELTRSLTVTERGHAFIRLTRKNMSLHNVMGSVENINFYCFDNFESVKFKPETVYQVPTNFDECQVLIKAKPSTTFLLKQF